MAARRLIVVVIALAAVGAWPSLPRAARFQSSSVSVSRNITVAGVAWSGDGEPLANARVQLRHVLTGDVIARSRTNENGEFAFQDLGEGTYVVELLNEDSGVLAVGSPFTVEAGQRVTTFIRLDRPAPWLVGVLRNTSILVLSAATTIGVIAVVRPGQPASPDR